MLNLQGRLCIFLNSPFSNSTSFLSLPPHSTIVYLIFYYQQYHIEKSIWYFCLNNSYFLKFHTVLLTEAKTSWYRMNLHILQVGLDESGKIKCHLLAFRERIYSDNNTSDVCVRQYLLILNDFISLHLNLRGHTGAIKQIFCLIFKGTFQLNK